jgi:hypothetical protein
VALSAALPTKPAAVELRGRFIELRPWGDAPPTLAAAAAALHAVTSGAASRSGRAQHPAFDAEEHVPPVPAPGARLGPARRVGGARRSTSRAFAVHAAAGGDDLLGAMSILDNQARR